MNEHSITKEWYSMTEKEKLECLILYASILKLDWQNLKHMNLLQRIFDLGSPNMILGYKGDDITSIKMEKESADIIENLIKIYL